MQIPDDLFWAIAAATIFSIFVAASYFTKFSRLQKWADEEGVRIVEKQLNRSCRFYVTIEDRDGHRFNGWVNVGGFVAAIASAKSEVVWDNRPDYLKR